MNINRKVNKIVFFDTVSDAVAYLRYQKDDGALFIAMKPTVYSYLKQKGVIAQNTLPYFTNDSHRRALEKSKAIVDWLRSALKLEEVYKESFIYWARLSVHYCLWTIEVVSNAVDIHRPEIISARFSKRSFVNSLCIKPQENYLGYIVNAIAQRIGLKFENISKAVKCDGPPFISRLPIYARSCVGFMLRYSKFKLWETIVSIQCMFHKEIPIFFTTRLYRMENLAKQLQLKNKDRLIHFLNAPVISSFGFPDFIIRLFLNKKSEFIMSQKRELLALENAIKDKKEFFSFSGITFADIIAQKTDDVFASNILGLMFWADRLEGFIDKLKPSAFVSSGARVDDAILAELCRQKGIRDILISHGSHVGPKNEDERSEWGEHGKALLNAPFSHLALQSPLAEEYLRRFTPVGKIIRTGPLIWGTPVNIDSSKALFKRIFNGKYGFGKVKIILHAGTPKLTHSFRFCVYETPDEYVQALCDLSNAVEKVTDAILIIKFRPKTELTVRALKNLVPFSEKVILSVEETFLDVLGMADLVASFSSTTIEEALQNRIPVLLYGGCGRYQHIPAYEIEPGGVVERAGVYHIKEAQNLESGITKILNLNLKRDEEDKDLFDKYIYGQDKRESLENLLSDGKR